MISGISCIGSDLQGIPVAKDHKIAQIEMFLDTLDTELLWWVELYHKHQVNCSDRFTAW